MKSSHPAPFSGGLHVSADPGGAEQEITDLIEGRPYSTALILLDSNVDAAFPSIKMISGRRVAVSVECFNEGDKRLASVERFTERYQHCLDCDSLIISIGGGALLDFTGFWSGVLHRGLRFAAVPTTVMGMADSVYGGKTAVHLLTMNQCGLYHQPEFVYVNTEFLRSLPPIHFFSGMVEIVKLSFFDRKLERLLVDFKHDAYLDDAELLRRLILRAAAMKLRMLTDDPLEQDAASRLLYGHSFANAFEAAHWEGTGEYLPHGHAVAMGMLLSSALAERTRPAFAGLLHRHRVTLERFAPLDDLVRGSPPASAVIECLRRDEYCAADTIRVPALHLDSGFYSVPLPLFEEVYVRWQGH